MVKIGQLDAAAPGEYLVSIIIEKSYNRSNDDTVGLDTHYKPKSKLMTAACNICIVLTSNKLPWVIVGHEGLAVSSYLYFTAYER